MFQADDERRRVRSWLLRGDTHRQEVGSDGTGRENSSRWPFHRRSNALRATQTLRDLTREKFITAIESIHEMNVGLGSELKLTYSPADHKGSDNVYPTIVQEGQPTLLTDCSAIGKAATLVSQHH